MPGKGEVLDVTGLLRVGGHLECRQQYLPLSPGVPYIAKGSAERVLDGGHARDPDESVEGPDHVQGDGGDARRLDRS